MSPLEKPESFKSFLLPQNVMKSSNQEMQEQQKVFQSLSSLDGFPIAACSNFLSLLKTLPTKPHVTLVP